MKISIQRFFQVEFMRSTSKALRDSTRGVPTSIDNGAVGSHRVQSYVMQATQLIARSLGSANHASTDDRSMLGASRESY
eukprot:12351446-Karenia_brevis.AAC.1